MKNNQLAILTAVIFALLSSRSGAQQIITTLAGNGKKNYSGDGGLSINAQLSASLFVRTDVTGNIYISDSWNYRIRKVDAATGIITTIAGTGTAGFSGDGGAATGAQIEGGPLFVDVLGNIYLSDNDRIRKIDAATGIIHTIVGTGVLGYSGDGGAADTAKLNTPQGIFVDNHNNIYFCDGANFVIRKVDGITNIITTIAGNGHGAGTIYGGFSGDGGPATDAELYYPAGIYLDGSGNIYFTDASNNRAREVTASTGLINTIAGDGSVGFTGDGGPAIDAGLDQPDDIAVDAAGNVYISDYNHDEIRKIDIHGVINTIAGNAGQGYNGDNITATSSMLYFPTSVCTDALGNVYIADSYNRRVRKINYLTGIITTAAGNGAVSFSGDGGPAGNAELNGPTAVCADGSGNVFIADNGNNRIREVNAAGVITTIAGSAPTSLYGGFSGDGGQATNAQLFGPNGVCMDGAGNIYFVDTRNYRVREINAATGIINTVAGNGSSVSSGDNGLAVSAGIGLANSVCADAVGNLYIANVFCIRMVAKSTGMITTIAGSPTTGGYTGDGGAAINALLFADAICIDGSNNLYFADGRDNVVRKITASTGTISTVAGNGTTVSTNGGGYFIYTGGYTGDGGAATDAELNYPNGVYVDAAGNIYIADNYNNVIRIVNVSTGIISTIAGDGYGAWLAPAVYGQSGGFSGDGGSPTDAELYAPSGVCMNNSGNILIADTYNNRVRTMNDPTSVKNTPVSIPCHIFPNPSTGQFIIQIGNNLSQNGVRVYNAIGENIYQSAFSGAQTTLNLTGEPSGIYFLYLDSDEKTMVQKLVIIH